MITSTEEERKKTMSNSIKYDDRDNRQLIQLEFQLRRGYSKQMNVLKEMAEMQGVPEPLMGVIASYALDAEQDYLAASDAFHGGDFEAGPAGMGRLEGKYGLG